MKYIVEIMKEIKKVKRNEKNDTDREGKMKKK
jgi:hypothetical protein